MNLQVCLVCWIKFLNDVSAESHFKSKQHNEKLKFKQDFKDNQPISPFFCEICCIYANSELALTRHLESDNHRLRLKSKNEIENLLNNQYVETDVKEHHSEIKISKPSNSILNYCNICKIYTNSSITFIAHLQGEKHKNKLLALENKDNTLVYNSLTNLSVTEKENYVINDEKSSLNVNYLCELCNLKFESSKSLNDHSQSMHSLPDNTNKIDQGVFYESINESEVSIDSGININENDSSAANSTFSDWCELCYVKFNSVSTKEKHLKGKDHLKRKSLKENSFKIKSSTHFCEVCFVQINSEEQLKQHNLSKSHLNQISKYQEFQEWARNRNNESSNEASSQYEELNTSISVNNIENIETEDQILHSTSSFKESKIEIPIFIKTNLKSYEYKCKNKKLLLNCEKLTDLSVLNDFNCNTVLEKISILKNSLQT